MTPLRYTASAGPPAADSAAAPHTIEGAAASAARATSPTIAVGRLLYGMEPSIEIGDEIVGILDSHRDADQSVVDADTIARFLRHAGMRRARGMRNQGLGAPQAHRQLDELQTVEQAERLGLAAFHGEAEGRPRALALAVEHRLAGIVRREEPEVVHCGDLGMAREKFRDPRRVLRRA